MCSKVGKNSAYMTKKNQQIPPPHLKLNMDFCPLQASEPSWCVISLILMPLSFAVDCIQNVCYQQETVGADFSVCL